MTRVYELRLSESLVNAIVSLLDRDVYEARSDLRLAERADWGVDAARLELRQCCVRLDAFLEARDAADVVQDDHAALFDPRAAS